MPVEYVFWRNNACYIEYSTERACVNRVYMRLKYIHLYNTNANYHFGVDSYVAYIAHLIDKFGTTIYADETTRETDMYICRGFNLPLCFFL